MDKSEFREDRNHIIGDPNKHIERILASDMPRERTTEDVLVKVTLGQVDIQELYPGMKVLELGLGAGTVLREVVRDYRVEGYGVDLRDMVPIGIPPITVVEANLEEGLPFDNETFDLVYAIQVMPYILDKLGLIKEVHRVLKVDSLGAVLDTTSRHSHQFFGEGLDKILKVWPTKDQVAGNYSRHPGFVGKALKSIVIEKLHPKPLEFPVLNRAVYFSNPHLYQAKDFRPQVESIY